MPGPSQHQPQKLDLNRGVLQRKHPNGAFVSMYYDAPGEYYDENGKALSRDHAAAAGFDVEHYDKQRRTNARLISFRKQLEAEEAAIAALGMDVVDRLQIKRFGPADFGLFDPETKERVAPALRARTKLDAEDMLGRVSGGDNGGAQAAASETAESGDDEGVGDGEGDSGEAEDFA